MKKSTANMSKSSTLSSTKSPTLKESKRPNTGKKQIEFELPTFSLVPKPKEEKSPELIKEKTARRQYPEGEDLPALKKIVREIGKNVIPVEEFVNLVSAYTADNGALMRQVLEEDTSAFRQLARKVYETRTQDVSDVLVNEQLQLMEFYKDRDEVTKFKMMKAVNEIFAMIPTFDFERYLKDGEQYLHEVLPIPEMVHVNSEGAAMRRRQEAYHRLQWLKSEGKRMLEENARLKKKLRELKIEQKSEQERIAAIVSEAEEERERLTREESQMKEKLEELNDSVEKSMIDTEAVMRKAHNEAVMKPPKKEETKEKTHRKKRHDWVSDFAAEIDDEAIHHTLAAEAMQMPHEVGVRHSRQKDKLTPKGRAAQFEYMIPKYKSFIKVKPKEPTFPY